LASSPCQDHIPHENLAKFGVAGPQGFSYESGDALGQVGIRGLEYTLYQIENKSVVDGIYEQQAEVSDRKTVLPLGIAQDQNMRCIPSGIHIDELAFGLPICITSIP
jgi:hypothetical protein